MLLSTWWKILLGDIKSDSYPWISIAWLTITIAEKTSGLHYFQIKNKITEENKNSSGQKLYQETKVLSTINAFLLREKAESAYAPMMHFRVMSYELWVASHEINTLIGIESRDQSTFAASIT